MEYGGSPRTQMLCTNQQLGAGWIIEHYNVYSKPRIQDRNPHTSRPRYLEHAPKSKKCSRLNDRWTHRGYGTGSYEHGHGSSTIPNWVQALHTKAQMEHLRQQTKPASVRWMPNSFGYFWNRATRDQRARSQVSSKDRTIPPLRGSDEQQSRLER